MQRSEHRESQSLTLKLGYVAQSPGGIRMSTTRRDLLTAALTAAGAAAASDLTSGEVHEHSDDPDHQAVPSDPTLRVKALESLLVAKGLVNRATLDALIDTFEHKVGPHIGARAVAHGWVRGTERDSDGGEHQASAGHDRR